MEDRHLYPLLLDHEDREVQETDGGEDRELRAELEEVLRGLSARILFEEETLIPLLRKPGIT